jgi:hypothetical protein
MTMADRLLGKRRQRKIHRFDADGTECERHGYEQRHAAPSGNAEGAAPERALAARVTLARTDLAKVA